MYDKNDAAAGLPIDSELDIAIKERARQLYEQYDISPEEAMQLARAEYMEAQDGAGESAPASPPQAAAPLPASPPQAAASSPSMSPEDMLRGQYEAAGMVPERASRIAANEARMYGPQGAAAKAGEQDSDAGRSRLAGVAAQLQADDERHQRMYDDYFSATAAPSHRRPLSASQQQMEDESRRYSAEASRIIHSGLHPQTPIDPGTPESLAEWESFLADNPRARARWRPDEVAAEEQASRDQEMDAVFQNIGQTYGPDEEAKAREAHGRGATYIPQTADQASRNERYRTLRTDAMKGDDDARQRLRAADANVDYDALNEQQRAALRQPGGTVSQQARTRWADAAGLSDAEAARMSSNDLRRLAADVRAADKDRRDLQWRPRTMIRGGNAIGALALPGMGDAQQAAILGGPTPLTVDVAAAQGDWRNREVDARLAAVQAQLEESRASRDVQLEEARANRQMMADQFAERLDADREQRAAERDMAGRTQALAEERLRLENQRALADLNARLQQSQMEMNARLGTTNAAVEEKRAEREMAQQLDQRGRQMAWQQQSPGLYDVATGRMFTDAANEDLKELAANSDRFQWLPGGGFGYREATALNDELLRLADQAAMLGIDSPLKDPKYRRKIIKQYGYASGWSGGRGGWTGDWWQPMPAGLE